MTIPFTQPFKQLENAPAYHTRITMQSNDPGMAQAAAMSLGISSMEKTVKDGTTPVIMHMKMPAMDMSGAVDDWEIRAVAQNGKVALMFFISSNSALKENSGAEFRDADGPARQTGWHGYRPGFGRSAW